MIMPLVIHSANHNGAGRQSGARLAAHMHGLEVVGLTISSSYGEAEFKTVRIDWRLIV